MTGPLELAGLVLAGTLAGVVGTAGGITSLVSYPALLLAGLAPLPATVANNIALTACWPGSALASQAELRGRGSWLRRWVPVAAVGGVAGAALLLSTPPGVFERIVPALVALGSILLLVEPRLTAWRERRALGGERAGLLAGVAGLSVYNGYFGAGAGVMTLTLLLVFADGRLLVANALKNMLVGAGCVASAVVLAFSASARWPEIAALGAGMFCGSLLGPRVARRLPATLLRWLIALLGLVLAVELALHAHG